MSTTLFIRFNAEYEKNVNFLVKCDNRSSTKQLTRNARKSIHNNVCGVINKKNLLTNSIRPSSARPIIHITPSMSNNNVIILVRYVGYLTSKAIRYSIIIFDNSTIVYR